MPHLPACFPSLPPSHIRLRSFELYHSSIFTVIVKADKFSNITFEYYDTSGPCNDEGTPPSSVKRKGKKMGYIITTMTTFSSTSFESELNSPMVYPAFKGIFLAEEYRHTSTQLRGGCRSLSRVMMAVYYNFLAHLYYTSNVGCINSGSARVVDRAARLVLRTGCVMRKVLVCKVLASHGWVANHSSKSFEVTVIPQKKVPSSPMLSLLAAPSRSVLGICEVGHGVESTVIKNYTRISSPVMSPEALQSRMFTPRTCQAQNIEILSWEEALSCRSHCGHEQQEEKLHSHEMMPGKTSIEEESSLVGGAVVSVNCEYVISITALLELVSEDEGIEDGVYAYETPPWCASVHPISVLL